MVKVGDADWTIEVADSVVTTDLIVAAETIGEPAAASPIEKTRWRFAHRKLREPAAD